MSPETMQRFSCAFLFLLLLLCQLSMSSSAQTCDFYNEVCPYPNDGECDVKLLFCRSGDCFDCDEAAQHDANCSGCVDAGYYWCPGDAKCLSLPLGETYWSQFQSGTSISSCQTEEDWLTTCRTLANKDYVFNDELYPAEHWSYKLLNVEPIWRQGLTGEGIMIRINDPDGVDGSHPEFASRFSLSASCEEYSAINETTSHGTHVASIAAGAANNKICAAGIAPGATLSACVGPNELTDIEAAKMFTTHMDKIDISINAWNFDACWETKDRQRERFLQNESCPFVSENEDNPCTECKRDFGIAGINYTVCKNYIVEYCRDNFDVEYAGCAEFFDYFVECGYNVLSPIGSEAIIRGVTKGRGGKGTIYVFAAGNEYKRGEVINMEGWLNTRFTITVGAVGKDGVHASYSSSGAALTISGPGGDMEYVGNHVAASVGGGCTRAGSGTSYATPAVAGVIALMLQANPDLRWRDVQGILASTAQKVDPENKFWVVNSAGFHHNDLYGFGLVDALAAVAAAKKWQMFGPERQIVVDSGVLNLKIPDNSTAVSSSMSVNQAGGFLIENVVAYLQLDHASRGDLEILLTSPGGSQSVLHPGLRPENLQLSPDQRWKLLTVKHFAEDPSGGWTLSITDKSLGVLNKDCVESPFMIELADDDGDFLVDCELVERAQFCKNGKVLDDNILVFTDADGKTVTDACCACGGGHPPSNTNALISWSMVIYGHIQGEDPGDPGHFQYTMGSPGEAHGGGEGSGASILTKKEVNVTLLGLLCATILVLIY